MQPGLEKYWGLLGQLPVFFPRNSEWTLPLWLFIYHILWELYILVYLPVDDRGTEYITHNLIFFFLKRKFRQNWLVYTGHNLNKPHGSEYAN
jgi:hypothetical protein